MCSNPVITPAPSAAILSHAVRAHGGQRAAATRSAEERRDEGAIKSRTEHLVERYPDHLAGSRGWGLLQGLVLKDTCEFSAADVVKAALEEQLLLVPAGTAVVRMVPPLVIGPGKSRPCLPDWIGLSNA